jgi:urease alpha subunit
MFDNFTACTPGPGHVEMMLRATDDIPLNFGFSGKGNTSDNESLKDVLRSGAAGFKCEIYLYIIL